MTEVSGMTGFSKGMSVEQDLSGGAGHPAARKTAWMPVCSRAPCDRGSRWQRVVGGVGGLGPLGAPSHQLPNTQCVCRLR